MSRNIIKEIEKRIGRFKSRFEVIAEINKKYAHPKIKMTRMVSISLFLLRIYLLILVALLFYKFFTLVK